MRRGAWEAQYLGDSKHIYIYIYIYVLRNSSNTNNNNDKTKTNNNNNTNEDCVKHTPKGPRFEETPTLLNMQGERKQPY